MSPPKALLDIPRILFRVTQLELDSLSFKDFPQLASLLGGFPKLKKFAASNLGWPDFALPSVDVCLPPILDAIFLGKCYKRDILDWMLTSKIVPTCRSLTLNPVGPMDTPSIGQYLEALGDELKELDVGFTSLDSGGDAEDFYANIDLSYNPCIEKIRIQELISGVQYRLSSPLPWILKSLSRLHPNTLKDVSFTIFLDSIEDLDPEDEPIEWDVMDELLCTRPLFSALQNVTFVVLGSLPLFLVKMVLQFRLPGIFRRDLLKVVDSNGETLV
ncbi:hypothetical protein DL96DRAFT_1561035 [Flagelloscypha sp. PMI_526]|nr:hypothetical protein DL96DRAFT_1561035 [Flagelloscypha sp. PMI_526]